MPLWGTSATNSKKPAAVAGTNEKTKHDTYATNKGWVYSTGHGEQVLVAVAGLNATLGAANINAVYFRTPTTYIQGQANAQVAVVFNQKVAVTGTPTLVVTGSNVNAVATYQSSSNNTNKLIFQFTVPANTQTLSVGAQTITTAAANSITSNSSAGVVNAAIVISTAMLDVPTGAKRGNTSILIV